MYNYKCEKKFEMQLNVAPFSDRYHKLIESKKKTIIYVKEVFDNSTYRYRGYNVIQAMKKSEKYDVIPFLIKELHTIYSFVEKFDIVVFQRTKWLFELETFMQIIKEKGIRTIYDMDDLIYNTKYVPKYLNSISDYRDFSIDTYFAMSKRYEIVASMCDGYIVTTDSLEKNMKSDFKRPVWILHNFLNTEQETESEAVTELKKESYEDDFVIGYFSGSNSHRRDLEIVESAMMNLMEKYDNIKLRIVGMMTLSDNFRKLEDAGKLEFSPFVSFEELQYEMGKVDLNIIPLQKHEFNDCKSELKYFEASIVNTLSCATNNCVYSSVIKDGVDGFLCNEIEWLEKIEYIYLNRDKMSHIIENANKKCHEVYDNKNQQEKIEKIYDEILDVII